MDNKNFIFFSNKRWSIINNYAKVILVLFLFFSLLVFLGFTRSPFSQKNTPKANLTRIIDNISTQSPGKIAIKGQGPVIKVAKEKESYFLTREKAGTGKFVYLTFDDGPDPVYTKQILDILDKENIKATFFVLGENIHKHEKIAKEIIDREHLIGLHTFTHTPEGNNLYKDDFQVNVEFELTQRILEEATGHKSQIFRLPYLGTEDAMSLNNLVLTVNAVDRGYHVVGSTVDSLDWQAENANEIIKTVKSQSKGINSPVLLLHDSGADRENTVAALPEIIAYYKDLGYKFGKVDQLYGQEVLTPLNLQEKLYAKSVASVYKFWVNLPKFITPVFVLGILGFGIHSILIGVLAIAHKHREKKSATFNRNYKPKVSVVIPAHNEENVITKTIDSVFAQSYQNFEIIVVDDGSTDKTCGLLNKYIFNLSNSKIKVIWHPNKGKFAALNAGFKEAAGEIVVAIDADTQITPDTLINFVRHFENGAVGAVAGNIKVANKENLLTFLQELDYRMAINLERRAYDYLNSVFVVPGAIGAWRKKVVEKVGGFSNITLTEDAELALRIRKAGYGISYEAKAVGYTEAPRDLSSFFRQRFRWTFGILQALWLHKDMNFKSKYKLLGIIILPYTVFIQLPLTFFALFVQFAAIPIAVFISLKLVVFSMAVLLIARLLLFILASKLADEDYSLSAFIIPYRFYYQFLWYFVFYWSFYVAVRGSIVSWKKLPHFGLAKLDGLPKAQQIITYS